MKKLYPGAVYLVHVWGYGPVKMAPSKAKALLKRHGGSYHWLDDTCHVYLRPVTEVTLKPPLVRGHTA